MFLIVVVILEFIFIIYQDISNRNERERLTLKMMSKDVREYKDIIDKPESSKPSKPSPYIPLDEISSEVIAKAKDNI